MVSLDGSVLHLASKVTLKGAEPLLGDALTSALMLYLLFISLIALSNGLKHQSKNNQNLLKE